MENTNLIDQEQAFEESKEKIFELLEEKKYFRCRDELLKFNAVDIAELLEEDVYKRQLQASQFVAEHGDQVCPARWTPGAATLKPGIDLVGAL